MNTIRMTEHGFVARGTARDFPRFADLEMFMGRPPCRKRPAPPLIAPWLRQLLDDLGTGLAIAALFAVGQVMIVAFA